MTDMHGTRNKHVPPSMLFCILERWIYFRKDEPKHFNIETHGSTKNVTRRAAGYDCVAMPALALLLHQQHKKETTKQPSSTPSNKQGVFILFVLLNLQSHSIAIPRRVQLDNNRPNHRSSNRHRIIKMQSHAAERTRRHPCTRHHRSFATATGRRPNLRTRCRV